jgi:hypothetical protein
MSVTEAALPADADPASACATTTCPACGRKHVVVFPLLRTGEPLAGTPYVCLKCCPRLADEAKMPRG